jgi:carbon catabolite-derepressing protein kinase
VIEGIGYIHS